MRWVDWWIDATYQAYSDSTVGSRLPDLGPFSRAGSLLSLVVCAFGLGVTIWTGITGSPTWFGGSVFLLVVGVTGSRTCVRAFRGDFEDFVIPTDDDEDQ